LLRSKFHLIRRPVFSFFFGSDMSVIFIYTKSMFIHQGITELLMMMMMMMMMIIIIIIIISFFHVALQPNAGYGLFIHEVFGITHTTRHSR
jgi:hypothetical protein